WRQRAPSVFINDVKVGEIHAIFSESNVLGTPSTIHLFQALSQVVLEQIDRKCPATFVFQILVVAATSNKDRAEDVWETIWKSLSPLFKKCCLHPDEDVSMGAVDCLRQIVSLFITKKEENSKNQRSSFEPFLWTVSDHENEKVKEFALTCIQNMSSLPCFVENMKSGWTTLFECLRFSVEFNMTRKTGFEILKKVFWANWTEIERNFVVVTNTIEEFRKVMEGSEENREGYLKEISRMLGEILTRKLQKSLSTREVPSAVQRATKSEEERVEKKTGLIPMKVTSLEDTSLLYMTDMITVYNCIVLCITSKYHTVAEDALFILRTHLLSLPKNLLDVVFFKTLYCCFSPELPDKMTKIMRLLYQVTLELPFHLVPPVVSFGYNVLLNSEVCWESTKVFFSILVKDEKFREISEMYYLEQEKYFKCVVDSLRGISSSVFHEDICEHKPNIVSCEVCHREFIRHFMAQCGCGEHVYCEEHKVNEHSKECVKRWKKWRIEQSGMSTISCRGLVEYFDVISLMDVNATVLKQLGNLWKSLFETLEKLPMKTVAKSYEKVVFAIFKTHIAALKSYEDIAFTFLKESANQIFSFYSTNGFVLCNSKPIILYVLEQLSSLEGDTFLKVINAVFDTLVVLISSDDLDVRKGVVGIIKKIHFLNPIHC
ncbi:HEAT repeat containing protein, partial [Entamoeba invadens IP1]